MPAAASHLALIDRLLRELGIAREDLLGFEQLQGGVSGSLTFLLRFPERRLVLKATLAGSPTYMLERAWRELDFLTSLAGQVPLRVPRLIAAHAGEDGSSALLLAAYRPAPPADAWPAAWCLEAAAQVARFHAAFWDDIGSLAGYSWLRSASAPVTDDELSSAHAYWQGLRDQERLSTAIPAGDWREVERLLGRFDALGEIIAGLPPTLCHGDCHAGNVLLDEDGAFVWADWQEVGIGRGPEDLSFFIQRATFGENELPYEQMLATYRDALAAALGEEIPLAAVRRIVEASELRKRLLHWPAYMQRAPTVQIEVLLSRIRQLGRRLEL